MKIKVLKEELASKLCKKIFRSRPALDTTVPLSLACDTVDATISAAVSFAKSFAQGSTAVAVSQFLEDLASITERAEKIASLIKGE